MNLYRYTGNNPVSWRDPYGYTFKSNLIFLWDWISESGEAKRIYGPDALELAEMQNSTGAECMREEFLRRNCQDIRIAGYGTLDAFRKSILNPGSTAFQVGGFLYSITNNGNGTATYSIYNQASLYSFFCHIPGVPHKQRGGQFPFGGNIDQRFEWTEPIPCYCD